MGTEDFVMVPIDKAANNETLKKLNLDWHLSNQDNNNTCEFINKEGN